MLLTKQIVFNLFFLLACSNVYGFYALQFRNLKEEDLVENVMDILKNRNKRDEGSDVPNNIVVRDKKLLDNSIKRRSSDRYDPRNYLHKRLVKRVIPHGYEIKETEYDNKFKTLYKPLVRVHKKPYEKSIDEINSRYDVVYVLDENKVNNVFQRVKDDLLIKPFSIDDMSIKYFSDNEKDRNEYIMTQEGKQLSLGNVKVDRYKFLDKVGLNKKNKHKYPVDYSVSNDAAVKLEDIANFISGNKARKIKVALNQLLYKFTSLNRTSNKPHTSTQILFKHKPDLVQLYGSLSKKLQPALNYLRKKKVRVTEEEKKKKEFGEFLSQLILSKMKKWPYKKIVGTIERNKLDLPSLNDINRQITKNKKNRIKIVKNNEDAKLKTLLGSLSLNYLKTIEKFLSKRSNKKNVEYTNDSDSRFKELFGSIGNVKQFRNPVQTNETELKKNLANAAAFLLDDSLRTEFDKSGEENKVTPNFDWVTEASSTKKPSRWISQYPFWNYWTYDHEIVSDICKGKVVNSQNICIEHK